MGMTAPQQHTPKGYGQACTIYRRAGWQGVLPLPANKKSPPPDGYTGRDGAYPTGPQVFEWTTQRGADGLALRLPKGVVGVDVDVYDSKHGDETLLELEGRYGPLPATWSSTSRGPTQPSRIWLFRCPEELLLPGKPGTSIEFIQHHHRYTVAWPTVVDGRLYRWYSPDGFASARPPKVNELAWLPDDWHRIEKPKLTISDWKPTAVSGDWSQAVTKHHSEGVAGLRDPGGRHDNMLGVIMSLVRADERGHPGAAEALVDLQGRFIVAVGDRSNQKAAQAEWERMESGAAGVVASTPASRSKYEDLRAEPRQPAQQPPPGAGDAPADPEPAEEPPEHGWEAVELGEVHDGNHQRPKPSLLRRTT